MISISDAVVQDGTLVFTITFDEALKATGLNAFTLADLDISNVSSTVMPTLTTTDSTEYTLTVTPANADFPVKVAFASDAKIGDTSDNLLVIGETPDKTYTPEGILGVEIDEPA